MKTLPLVLVIVAIIGLVLSIYPGFGFGLGGRGNFARGQGFNSSFQNGNGGNGTPGGFMAGVGSLLTFVRIGLWIVVLVLAIIISREPASKRS